MNKPMPRLQPNVKINPNDYQRVVVNWDQDAQVADKQAVLSRYGALPLNESVNMDWPKMVVWLPTKWTVEQMASEPTIAHAEQVASHG